MLGSQPKVKQQKKKKNWWIPNKIFEVSRCAPSLVTRDMGCSETRQTAFIWALEWDSNHRALQQSTQHHTVCVVIVWLCFEPSQPLGNVSGLKRHFNLSPIYSFHKSLYHKTLFLKPQLDSYPKSQNANPEKNQKTMRHVLELIYIPRALNTGTYINCL